MGTRRAAMHGELDVGVNVSTCCATHRSLWNLWQALDQLQGVLRLNGERLFQNQNRRFASRWVLRGVDGGLNARAVADVHDFSLTWP